MFSFFLPVEKKYLRLTKNFSADKIISKGESEMFGFNFGMFNFMFSVVFFIVVAVFVVTFVKGIMQWNKNNRSPRLTVEARVVTKRTDVSHHHHHHGTDVHMGHTSSSTTYYVTFEVESGDRMELKVQGFDFGMLVEGDGGRLTFQGTRFLGFERN